MGRQRPSFQDHKKPITVTEHDSISLINYYCNTVIRRNDADCKQLYINDPAEHFSKQDPYRIVILYKRRGNPSLIKKEVWQDLMQ